MISVLQLKIDIRLKTVACRKPRQTEYTQKCPDTKRHFQKPSCN